MEALDKLIEVADILLGEKGCPWDVKQTFESLQPYLLEECHEVLEAVDHKNIEEMVEELGDVLYIIIFYCKLGEKAGKFTMAQVADQERDKLIRRHPHVFGEEKAETSEEVLSKWTEMKKTEAKKKGRKTLLDGIPKTLNALAKAQKIIHKLKHEKAIFRTEKEKKLNEEILGKELIELIYHADELGLDAESVLRRALEAFTKSP